MAQSNPPKKLSLHKMIPNMITLTALAAGMTGIKYAIAERWEMAAGAIVVAAFMDAFDGAAARLLKAQSKLGAELDSFSDFICFGVAPAIIMYLWALSTGGKWTWPVAVIFAISVALRLSRFNIATEDADPNDPLKKFFTGVPSPLGAGLCIFPLIISFQVDPSQEGILRNPQVVACWSLIVAAMMVSNIPTISSKQIRIPYKMKVPALAVFGILVACLFNDPWPTLSVVGVVYLLSLPFGIQIYNRKSAQHGAEDHDKAED